MYAGLRLSLRAFRKHVRESCDRQLDSGKPTVQDERGALRKCGLWETDCGLAGKLSREATVP